MKLADKVAIVTGAGKEIGKGIALELAKAGADVVANYAHSEMGAKEVVTDIKAIGRNAIAIQADVSQASDVNAMIDQAYQVFGRIDILVNNAGVTIFRDFFEVSEADWDMVLGVNLKGTFLCSQAAARRMKEVGDGKIINIGSVHSQATLPEFTPYVASKGGIDALTRQMALALAPYKINVNTIAPGLIEVEKIRANPIYDRAHRAKQIPWGRVGFPEDIGKIVVFFASEESEFITGQVLFVDGGQLAKLSMVRDVKDKPI